MPFIVLDRLTETQKRAYIIADNKLAENAGWDGALPQIELAALQQESLDVRLIGFDDEELARLLAAQNSTDVLTDEDAVPDITESPTTVPGDIWILGSHRLLCGHATSGLDVMRLMAGGAAGLVFSDLPYNCDYEGYTKGRLKIQNDKMTPEQFRRFLESAFREVGGQWKDLWLGLKKACRKAGLEDMTWHTFPPHIRLAAYRQRRGSGDREGTPRAFRYQNHDALCTYQSRSEDNGRETARCKS
jgi:hypothetical protein